MTWIESGTPILNVSHIWVSIIEFWDDHFPVTKESIDNGNMVLSDISKDKSPPNGDLLSIFTYIAD